MKKRIYIGNKQADKKSSNILQRLEKEFKIVRLKKKKADWKTKIESQQREGWRDRDKQTFLKRCMDPSSHDKMKEKYSFIKKIRNESRKN